jgi:hypothetical protein
MYVLLGISPRALSIFCNIDLGRVIAILSVLSTAAVVLLIRVFYILLPSYKDIVYSILLQLALCLRNSEKQDQTICQALLVSMFLLSFLSENNFSATVTTLSIQYHQAPFADASHTHEHTSREYKRRRPLLFCSYIHVCL